MSEGYAASIESIESQAEFADVDTHCALCFSNYMEFDNMGYDGMADLCMDDHDLYLFDDQAERIYHLEMRHGVAHFINMYAPVCA